MIRIELSIRNILTILGVLAGLWLLTKVWSVILLAGVALLIAASLMPYVDWLAQRTRSRTTAVLIVVLTVLAALSLILLLIVPPMIAQGRDLWDQAPELQNRAARFADERGWYGLRDRIQAFEPGDAFDLFDSQIVDTSRTVLNVLIALVTTFFLAAYFLVDARRLEGFLYFSTPDRWHRHIKALLPALQRVVGGYIRGQAITSAAIFAFSLIVLTIFRVPNAVALSAIAAIADLIPLVGVYIFLAPMALAALSVSVTTAIIVVAVMVAYQQVEDRVLIPRVYGATLRLPTIAVVLAILAGAELLGLVGALLALPIAAGVRVMVEYFAGVRKTEPPDTTLDAEAAGAAAATGPADEPFAPDANPAPEPAKPAGVG